MIISTLMEGGGRTLLDASCYTLFEASGDSESEYYDTAALGAATATTTEDDDAESCSCGYSSGSVAAHEIDASGGYDFLDATGVDDCVEGGGGEDDGCGTTEVEDGVVDQRRHGKAAAVAGATAELNKSKGCEDSSIKIMSERDMDRLFWEACLAS